MLLFCYSCICFYLISNQIVLVPENNNSKIDAVSCIKGNKNITAVTEN